MRAATSVATVGGATSPGSQPLSSNSRQANGLPAVSSW